jgi:tight adherence protein C
MIWIIWVMTFATFFLLMFGFVTVWNRRNRVKIRAISTDSSSESPLLRGPKDQPSAVREWAIEGLKISGEWALSDLDKVSEMRKDLLKAGYRHPQAPAVYLGLRIIAAFAFALPFLLIMVIRGQLGLATLVMAFGLVVIGFFLPVKLLHVKIKKRQENLDRALPDIIDLFVICMDAGLSLNAALQRVAEEIQGAYQDFSDELQIASKELRAGIPWEEAFDNLGKRTDVQSIRSMVGLMIQSNKLGASIGDALRHHADFIRTQRLLRAEEKAAKLTIKMIFPLIFCIMPAMLIVAGGPGIIHFLENFSKFVPQGGAGFPR